MKRVFFSIMIFFNAICIIKAQTQDPATLYPQKMGNLRFKTNYMVFPSIYNTETKTDTVKFYNEGDKSITLSLSNIPDYLKCTLNKKEVKPKESGMIIINYDASKVNDFGFVMGRFNIVTNDSLMSQKIISVAANIVEDFSKLISTSDGNFILAGSNYLSSNALRTEQSYQFKSLIFKINPNGDVIWNHSEQYNGGDCIATDVIEASDGYYYTSNSAELTDNAVISKLDFDGNLIWFKNFSTQSNEYIYSLSNTTDQAIICLIKSNANNFGDKTEDSFGLSDYWVVKLQPSNLNNTIKEQFNFEVFPNPFLSKINIINNNLINYNVLLYNSLGQEIIRIDNFNDKIQTFDVTILSGYYFLKVTNTITNEFINFKLIKL